MDELKSIILRAKDDVYTRLQGGNFSKVLGKGYDFSELRAYNDSDDIRHISWINFAKSNELYVKKMHEERELLLHVSILVDGRTIIGRKQVIMTQVLALLAYSSVYTNNLLEVSFSFGSELKIFEAMKNIESIEKTLNELYHIEPLALKVEYDKVESRLLKIQEDKSLFFLVGDFMDELDLSILAQKHELYVVIVRDRWEENPQVNSDVELVSPLSNTVIAKMVSKRALSHYVKKLKEHDEKLYAHFDKHNIKYVKIYDTSEVFEKLEQLIYL